MMKRNAVHILSILICFCLFFLTGCITTSSTPIIDDGTDLPPVEANLPAVAGFADDIQDVVIPPELQWDRKESMSITTESFRGGVWKYTGEMDIIALKDYLTASMQDNTWKQVGESTAQDIMLAFLKPSKTCMMLITELSFQKVELTLFITIDKTATTGMNPFGEVIQPR